MRPPRNVRRMPTARPKRTIAKTSSQRQSAGPNMKIESAVMFMRPAMNTKPSRLPLKNLSVMKPQAADEKPPTMELIEMTHAAVVLA